MTQKYECEKCKKESTGRSPFCKCGGKIIMKVEDLAEELKTKEKIECQ